MSADQSPSLPTPPTRWQRPSALTWLALVLLLAFVLQGLNNAELSLARLVRGFFRLGNFLAQAFPPTIERLPNLVAATVETFQMALIGTLFGALLSLPLAVLAARTVSPHPLLHLATRSLIGFMRAVPDLIWGLIFIVAVGLGPAAGILAIMIDTISFCGRFYAERIEELDSGPLDALRATGATYLAVLVNGVAPAALPSFVATTLFSLEGSVRSAVVLGLVGAGGIGIELATAMQLLRYEEAATIIIIIFVVVIGVERLSSTIRRRVL
ncbi:MAG: phosphonate ABC transporter, permease protein PhnE [Caldilineaceae bacterium]